MTVVIPLDDYDDTELGAMVRDLLAQGKDIAADGVAPFLGGCERHPNPDWCCVACGEEPAFAPTPEGVLVTLTIRAGRASLCRAIR